MRKTPLLLLGLACSGYGRRHMWHNYDVGGSGPEENAIENLAAFLLAVTPSALTPSNVAARSQPSVMDSFSRRDVVQTATSTAAGVGAAGLTASPAVVPLAARADSRDFSDSDWELLDIKELQREIDAEKAPPTVFDVAFDDKDPNFGLLIGTRKTVLATEDGGKKWSPRNFEGLDAEEDIEYRFTSVSIKDSECWIVGKPPILLHSTDNGKNWERVPLSAKLPGDPNSITGTGPGQAEMTTSTGAIYYTKNAGRNFVAQVKEAIDATLNRVTNQGVQGASFYSGSIASIARDVNGNYIAVPARGNFFLTWTPGREFWLPHNRRNSRRIAAIGYIQDDINKGLWVSSAGGELAETKSFDENLIDPPFDRLGGARTGGRGLLDVCYANDGKTVIAVGGAGLLLKSTDGGVRFERNENVDRLPTNLYKVKQVGDGQLYLLGSDGVVLKNKRKLA